MQGTQHVRSLIRLFIGAVLLCLAWLVLTSGHASAAERPAPAQPLSDLGRTIPLVDRAALETALDHAARTTRSDAAATPKATAQKHSGATTYSSRRSDTKPLLATTTHEVVRQVVPVLEQVDAAKRATVDSGLALVTDVTGATAELPLAGRPVAQVTDAVLALVQTLPAVDVPAPIVPLPIGGGTPTDVVQILVPGVLPAVPTAADVLPTTLDDSITAAWAGAAQPEDANLSRPDSSARTVARAVPVRDREPAAPGSPFEPVPAVPSQPSPTGGASPSTSDPAIPAVRLVLPSPHLFGRSSTDWRVPRGLPAHPGSRPD